MCFRRQLCLRILPTKLLEAVTKWKRKPQRNLRCKQITLSADPVYRIRNSKWLTFQYSYRFGSCHQHSLILQKKRLWVSDNYGKWTYLFLTYLFCPTVQLVEPTQHVIHSCGSEISFDIFSLKFFKLRWVRYIDSFECTFL